MGSHRQPRGDVKSATDRIEDDPVCGEDARQHRAHVRNHCIIYTSVSSQKCRSYRDAMTVMFADCLLR